MASNTLMMSDDSDDPSNHEDGVNLLYFDAHVEFTQQVKPVNVDSGGDIGKNKPVDMLRN